MGACVIGGRVKLHEQGGNVFFNSLRGFRNIYSIYSVFISDWLLQNPIVFNIYSVGGQALPDNQAKPDLQNALLLGFMCY